MGKFITIIIVILIIFGVYSVIQNRATVNTANNTYASSTVASSTTGTTTAGSSSTSTATNASSTTASVAITNFAFSPATLHITLGTKVTWTNHDTVSHTVTSTTGNELNSPRLANGQAYSHTFTKAGTFNYYCTVHPNMKGTIVVSQ